MNRYSEETIQQVLSATNIVDMIGAYFPLKRAGKDYRANCPFHNEKTPSFYVIPNKQLYHCFGCGAGGTALKFVMEYENVDFRTALKKLADKAGINLPEEGVVDPEAERMRKRRGKLLTVLSEAAKFFHESLLGSPDGRIARDYLKGRGLDKGIAVDWQLGYASDGMAALAAWAKDKGFNARDLIDTGLASLKDESKPKLGIYPRFRHRLMFPIHNDYGDVIGFSGRVLDPDSKLAKYVNSPETTLFHKGSILYGLHRAKRPILKAGAAIVCEGQMDLIAMAAAGFAHAVAPLGTALTREHARLLKRHTEVVTLCYDADAAGIKAADRAFAELAPAGLVVKVAQLPPGEDPDSLLRKEGVDALAARIDAGIPYVDFFFARHQSALASDDPGIRAPVARQAATMVARFSDPMVREDILRQTAIRLSHDTESFRQEVRKETMRLETESRRPHDFTSEEQAEAEVPEVVVSTPQTRAVETLVHLALVDSQARAILAGPEGEFCRSLPTAKLLCTIVSAGPDPSNPAATNAFLATLPADAEGRLLGMLARPVPKDVSKAVRDCLGKLTDLHRREANRRLRTGHLENRNLSIDEILQIQQQIQKQALDRREGVQHDGISASLPSVPTESGAPNPDAPPAEDYDDPF